ncbi:MAG: hypothetical protein AAGC56_10085, partial [Pseudomonadota bacterium]
GDGRAHYRLTANGEALRPTMRALMFWSVTYFMQRTDHAEPREALYSDNLNPDSVALAIEIFGNIHASVAPNYVLHLYIDDNPYTYFFMNGELTARRGADAPAVAQVRTDVATVLRGLRHEIALDEVRKRSAMTGDAEVLDAFLCAISPGGNAELEVAALIEADRKAMAS